MTAFTALALQVRTRAINGATDPRAEIRAAIERIGAQVGGSKAWLGPGLRLVVLPEYALTGFPMRESFAEWRERAALDPGGPEYRVLAGIAVTHEVFLCVNAYERDEHFPELYFQASVIFSPAGEVVLRYRRLHSMFTPTPYDVWGDYVEIYGMDAVLPVARTEIGNLAVLASEEILMPELARALTMRGAEVFCQPTSEASSPTLTPKAIARRARAVENLAYVVSANTGGLSGTAIPGDSTNGGSELIDHEGRVLAQAGAGESLVAAAELDLAALRRARRRPGMANLPSRVKTGLWAEEYARHDGERPGGLAAGARDRAWFRSRQAETIERLYGAD
ncbi:nitrilase-related carbon-nitrogen hydrolase [Nonomuraea turcica]|uniref:nitrilase-related carbon-nitrogen hydrolase n=1 Tax=Nonomuraea sp. G32 TaxID=3067274 RepID=UPI00273ADD3D|nr:nitrilase-related carbon-nitrogen hydrolase [Nonomuraea sp. G32]MDP4501586.1 nitrilase-related carbon-nitrogen hydrolase [Nonomuraea sp. G32]